MVRKFDFLVIGSGIAGMSFALKVAHKGKVALICKSGLEEANTYFAQGGVASVTNLLVDNFDKHIEDTMNAGDWISDRAAVEKVVREAPAQIEELIKWGVDFDKNEKGEFDLHREGGHSEFRILHHKDNTGAEIQDSLIKAVQRHPNITVIENQFAIEILTQHHLGVTVTRQTPDIKCYGAYILDPKTGKVDTYLAKVTLMATGGVGAVYKTTTNPLVATGDGIAMVYRAKGTVKDMEFVQFHQNYSYEDFIMGFRPSATGFELKKGAFYNFCKKAEVDSDNEYFFIIDEINRGNLSKIFGELFMLIENDKRGNALQLLYSDEKFAVPKNVYIIGMMNTADRSLAMLDYALRRRFAFFDIKPGFETPGFREYRRALDNEKFNKLISCVESLNREISIDESLGEGFCIGHSYFCNLQPDTIDDSWLYGVVEYELIPLLKEYWFDEPMKVKDWSENLRSTIK